MSFLDYTLTVRDMTALYGAYVFLKYILRPVDTWLAGKIKRWGGGQ